MASAMARRIATFAQGMVLGAFIQGFEVEGREFAGGSFDCFTPFSLLTGRRLLFGYGLLGAGWLVLKTEGELQDCARRLGPRLPRRRRGGDRRRQPVDAVHQPADRRALVRLAEHRAAGAGAARHRRRRRS